MDIKSIIKDTFDDKVEETLPAVIDGMESFLVQRIQSDEIKKEWATWINEKVNLPFMNEKQEQEFFERLVDINNITNKTIKTKSREIKFTKCSANVAYCTFDFICNSNLGHQDYTNIAKNFNLIFIEKVPQMTKNFSDQCRRFISLIDMLYENKCSVVILAENPITSLCQIKNLSKEFERTASRLYEMTIIKKN